MRRDTQGTENELEIHRPARALGVRIPRPPPLLTHLHRIRLFEWLPLSFSQTSPRKLLPTRAKETRRRRREKQNRTHRLKRALGGPPPHGRGPRPYPSDQTCRWPERHVPWPVG